MAAAAYVGRVGGLAIALGVGTAIVTGQGVAIADDGASGSPNPSGSSATGNAAHDTNTKADSKREPTSEPTKAPSTTTTTTTTTKTTSTTTITTTSTSTGAETPELNAEEPVDPTKDAESTKTPDGPDVDPETSSAPTTSANPSTSAQPSASAPEPSASPKPTGGKDKPAESNPAESKTSRPTPSRPITVPPPKAKPKPAPGPASLPENTSIALAVAKIAGPSASVVSASPLLAQAAVTPSADVLPAATVVPRTPLTIVADAVSRVVNWVLGPVAGRGPTGPVETPLAWTLVAYVRREFDNLVAALGGTRTVTAPTTLAAETTSLALTAPLAAAAVATSAVNVPNFPLPGAQLSPSTSFVNWVTGNYQTGNPLMADTASRFGIWGTDVGVAWDNGMVDDPTTPYDEHQILMAFGDTFSAANMSGIWRFNTLLRSSDHNLADGISVPGGEWFNGNMFGGAPLSNPTFARPIINRIAGLPTGVTLIPTAGISVPTPGTRFGVTQYVNFMSVSQWGAAGSWTTNYSGIAYSTDNGENFTIAPSTIRYNQPWGGNQNFQQGAFVRPGDGYVYDYGTPNGRQGAAYVSRVAEKDILDLTKYEYYSKGSAGFFGFGSSAAGWYRNDPGAATPVFGSEGGACGATKAGNTVSEMSVQYNKQLKKYVALYGDQNNSIVMRTSDTPQGGWSAATVLLKQQAGGIYAPMMIPWSPSTLGTGSDLYWNLSLYSEYNVMLMRTDLTKV